MLGPAGAAPEAQGPVPPPKVRSPLRVTDRALARSASTAAVHTRRRGAAGTRAIPAAASTARRPRAMPPSVTMIPTITRATVVWPARQASRTMPSAHGAMTAAAATPAPPKRQPAIRPAGHPQAVSVRSGETASPRRREALDRAPDLRAGIPLGAEVRHPALDEALRGLVAEDEVQLLVAPPGALHRRGEGGRHHLEADREQVPPVAQERHVHQGPAYLTGLRARPRPARDREPPLGGVAPELSLAEPALSVGARLHERRPPSVPQDEAGNRVHELLDRARLPRDVIRHPLAGGHEHAPRLAGADQGVRQVEAVDEPVACIRQVEDARVARAYRLGDGVTRRWLDEVFRDAAEDDHVDRQGVDLGMGQRLARGGGRKLARVHVGVGPPPLADAGHPPP